MNTSPNGWQSPPMSVTPGYQNWANYGNAQSYPQQPQSMAQQPTQAPFAGRFIADISEVVPSEVPMDGRAALFPNKSLEEVYLKMWNRDGELKSFRYILDPNQKLSIQQPSRQEDVQAMLLRRIDELEEKINGIGQSEEQTTRKNSKGGEK